MDEFNNEKHKVRPELLPAISGTSTIPGGRPLYIHLNKAWKNLNAANDALVPLESTVESAMLSEDQCPAS